MLPAIFFQLLWPPPNGSLIISSEIPNFKISLAVIFKFCAAISDFLASRNKIEAHPSGEITE